MASWAFPLESLKAEAQTASSLTDATESLISSVLTSASFNEERGCTVQERLALPALEYSEAMYSAMSLSTMM